MKTLAAEDAPTAKLTRGVDVEHHQAPVTSSNVVGGGSATVSREEAAQPRTDDPRLPDAPHQTSASNRPASGRTECRGPSGHATQRTRIVIADKNPVVRAGLRDYLEGDGRFEVVDVVNGGNAFVSVCEANSIDVGVIGWAMPDMTGSDVLGTVKRRQIGTRVIIYTGDSSPTVLRQAVKDGAWGFILKSDDPELLIETLVSVSRGRLSLPFVDISSLANDPLEQLTKRERELLRALANGLTNEQIAARIGISHNTVKYHLKNLYDKLGVRNRAMAVGLYMTIPEDCR
ncbi:MAG: response regulator transcription factor [Pseudomonadota bacterium]